MKNLEVGQCIQVMKEPKIEILMVLTFKKICAKKKLKWKATVTHCKSLGF